MPLLPAVPPFAEFLNGVRLTKPTDSSNYEAISWQDCAPDGVWDIGASPLREVAAERLWVPKHLALTWERFEQRLQQGLRESGHPATALIAWTICALFTWLNSDKDSTAAFNRLDSLIEPVHYRQIYYFPWRVSSEASVTIEGLFFGASSSVPVHYKPDHTSVLFDSLLHQDNWCIASPVWSMNTIEFAHWQSEARKKLKYPMH